MKITIEYYDEKVSFETKDNIDLDQFQDNLTRILRVMWLPEQVDKIMRVQDWDDGYKVDREAK